jgi:hypothetical protein
MSSQAGALKPEAERPKAAEFSRWIWRSLYPDFAKPGTAENSRFDKSVASGGAFAVKIRTERRITLPSELTSLAD